MRKFPLLQLLSEILRDSGGAPLMSGSGPTVFAAFTEQQQAQQYYKTIKPVYPGAILSRTVNKTMLEERVELYGNE